MCSSSVLISFEVGLLQSQKIKGEQIEANNEKAAVTGKQSVAQTKVDHRQNELYCLYIFILFFCCVGQDANVSDGPSLMDQLRGEALKFHKPGE